MTRRCSLCERELELTTENFYLRRIRKSGLPLFDYRCHRCRNMVQHMWRRRNRLRVNEYHRQYMAEIRTRPVLDKMYREKNAARMRLARKKKKESLLSVDDTGTGPSQTLGPNPDS